MLDLDTDGNVGGGRQNQWGTVYGYNGDLITQEIVDAIGKVDGVVDYNSEDTASYYGAGVDFKYLPAAFGHLWHYSCFDKISFGFSRIIIMDDTNVDATIAMNWQK